MDQNRTNAYGFSYRLDNKTSAIQNYMTNGINLFFCGWGFMTTWLRIIFRAVFFLLELRRHFNLFIRKEVVNKYLYNAIISFGVTPFFSRYFITSWAFILSVLDLSHTFYIHMGFTSTEIKTEIWISLYSFIRSDSVLPQQKSSAMALLSGWGLVIFKRRTKRN